MFANAPGPPAAPPATGLVASAARPTIDRWELGLAWQPERCGVGYRLASWGCDTTPPGYVPPRLGSAYYRPVSLDVADECSTLGGDLDTARLLRLIEAVTPYAVARELWLGEATRDDPYTPPRGVEQTNPYLASAAADVVGGTPAEARAAVGRLEQAALEETRGQQVMLHVPVAALPHLDGYVRPVGAQLITLAGSVLVADAGYPGTGPAGQPAGATAWAYATPPVQVLLSTPAVIDDPAATTSRVNTRTVLASRMVAAVFDPCALLATEITL